MASNFFSRPFSVSSAFSRLVSGTLIAVELAAPQAVQGLAEAVLAA